MAKENKIIALIQARMGATRLAGKVLLDLCGNTVLERVIERVKRCSLIDDVVVATTVNKADLAVVKACADKGISVYCGSEADVLDRFYQAARLFEAVHVVRITSDCPMIDPAVITKVIRLHLSENAEYTSNVLKETYPDGQDVEIMTFRALQSAWEKAELLSEREHVTPYIRKNPKLFRLRNLENKVNLGAKRWTLDCPRDYEFIKKVYEQIYSKNNFFGISEIMRLLDLHPEYENINRHINRNEGYVKSLALDKRRKNSAGRTKSA